MTRLFLFTSTLLLTLTFTGCNQPAKTQTSPDSANREVVEREGEPDFIMTKNDRLLEIATKEAQRTLPEFDKLLREPPEGVSDFIIKKGFAYGDDSHEHIWCNNVVPVEGGYQADINNEPVEVTDLELGQTVLIKPEEISDWMYYEGDQMRGGYTVVALVYGTEDQDYYAEMMGIDWSRYDILTKAE